MRGGVTLWGWEAEEKDSSPSNLVEVEKVCGCGLMFVEEVNNVAILTEDEKKRM